MCHATKQTIISQQITRLIKQAGLNKACYLRAVGSATTSDACVTLGVLTLPAIKQVKQAGLDKAFNVKRRCLTKAPPFLFYLFQFNTK